MARYVHDCIHLRKRSNGGRFKLKYHLKDSLASKKKKKKKNEKKGTAAHFQIKYIEFHFISSIHSGTSPYNHLIRPTTFSCSQRIPCILYIKVVRKCDHFDILCCDHFYESQMGILTQKYDHMLEIQAEPFSIPCTEGA